jgi:hypothetical protein
MHYLVVFENGIAITTADKPKALANSTVRMTQAHDTLYAAQLALSAYRLGRREIGAITGGNTAVLEAEIDAITGGNTAVLEAEIDEYKATIKRLVESIDKLHEQRENMRNCADGLRRVLIRVMTQLSLQNVLQNTHRERNRQNGEIVRDVHYWINKPTDEFSSDTANEMDDIPF